MARDTRTPILYLAPWVDLGGSDKATIDWFRWLDRDRFAPSLITTQPSANRRLGEVRPYAKEFWSLPDLMPADDFPGFIFRFIASRGIELVHIMNSRIAFDLLPDLHSLQPRPATVVQLHVEEETRDGYVRYVTTRYGNLVDAFSVSGHHLAAAMADYDVPEAKRRVIHTGVDADREFDPERHEPLALADGRFHVLFAARLVGQKDPQLMLEVAERLVAEQPTTLVHVIGDGPMAPELRERAEAAGLRDHVTFHGSSTDLTPWYRSCHALLMTSTFEGIPVTVFEALAMRLPIVAPALPGIAELLGDAGGTLVQPRDDVGAYVRALAALAADEEHRRAVADAAREHVRARFGVQGMADAHAELYGELLARREAKLATAGEAEGDRPDPRAPVARRERVALVDRPSTGRPRVSVIVPCFNHGLFLPACLEAIRRQGYPDIEVIVVDDASTDPGTQAVIADLEAEGWANVIRQERNRGPSAARNAALQLATGRYVLPVDSDNLLLPGAIDALVEQLQCAGETVGFVYPNLQYFGNRDDYFAAPDYNLYALLRGNYADTCSLFDRAVFDAGLRFAEDIELGHEDWDLMLQLADMGVRGEPAHGRTLLYRKHGFTRSDTVEYAQAAFHEEIAPRHPSLFGDPAIKARDCPGLSIVVADPLDGGTLATVANRLVVQTLDDVELIACFDGAWPRPDDPRRVRRIPPGEADDAVAQLEIGLELARSPRVLVITHDLAGLLAHPAMLEKLMYLSKAARELDAVGLIDAGEQSSAFAPAPGASRLAGTPHGALLHRTHQDAWPRSVLVAPGREIASLLGPLVAARNAVHWCHLPAAPRAPDAARGARARWVELPAPDPVRRAGRAVHALRFSEPPRLPGEHATRPRRWAGSSAWIPPETLPLVRHCDPHTGRRAITNERRPPAGHVIEWDLGVVQRFSPPGTARLEHADGAYRTVERGSPRSDAPGVVELGHVEQAPLPLLAALLVATHRPTGHAVLLSGDEDPLLAECDVHGGLGFIEGYPLYPRTAPLTRDPDFGLRGLLRVLDGQARRHVYALDAVPDRGELVGELGALVATPDQAAVPLWLDPDGRVHTPDYHPRAASPAPGDVARWAVAPASWRDFGHRKGRVRAVARRALDAPAILGAARNGARAADGEDAPAGHLFADSGPGRLPLWAGVHPVTGDQLLARHEYELVDLGYAEITLLGFLRERAPVTGTLALARTSVPWASRFGLRVRPS